MTHVQPPLASWALDRETDADGRTDTAPDAPCPACGAHDARLTRDWCTYTGRQCRRCGQHYTICRRWPECRHVHVGEVPPAFCSACHSFLRMPGGTP